MWNKVKGIWNKVTNATKITFVRLALLPVILFFYVGAFAFSNSSFFVSWGKFIAMILFGIAAITDLIDGYIARKHNEVTDMGKLLDPIADKMLTFLGFVLICVDTDLLMDFDGFLPVWAAVLVLFVSTGRDFVINALRQLAAEKGKTIAADWAGKIKSVLQYFGIGMFMFYACDMAWSNAVMGTGLFLSIWRYTSWFIMATAMVLSIYSAIMYLIKNKGVFGASDNDHKTEPAKVLKESNKVEPEQN